MGFCSAHKRAVLALVLFFTFPVVQPHARNLCRLEQTSDCRNTTIVVKSRCEFPHEPSINICSNISVLGEGSNAAVDLGFHYRKANLSTGWVAGTSFPHILDALLTILIGAGASLSLANIRLDYVLVGKPKPGDWLPIQYFHIPPEAHLVLENVTIVTKLRTLHTYLELARASDMPGIQAVRTWGEWHRSCLAACIVACSPCALHAHRFAVQVARGQCCSGCALVLAALCMLVSRGDHDGAPPPPPCAPCIMSACFWHEICCCANTLPVQCYDHRVICTCSTPADSITTVINMMGACCR